VHVHAKTGDTIRTIAARYGRPDLWQTILQLNSRVRIENGHFLRSATQVLKPGTTIRLPGTLVPSDEFSVLCGDNRPTIADGYAMYDVVSRPGRIGVSRFLGYNPFSMPIDIQFEAFDTGDGTATETKIAALERMAGRGDYAGAAVGPPAVIRVSVTDANGDVVLLIPSNYQWTPDNPAAPLWRITDISWAGGDYSDDKGQRIRSAATVTLTQYTPLTLVKRSASQRARDLFSAGSAAGSSLVAG
jgi:hypothetical protein